MTEAEIRVTDLKDGGRGHGLRDAGGRGRVDSCLSFRKEHSPSDAMRLAQ